MTVSDSWFTLAGFARILCVNYLFSISFNGSRFAGLINTINITCTLEVKARGGRSGFNSWVSSKRRPNPGYPILCLPAPSSSCPFFVLRSTRSLHSLHSAQNTRKYHTRHTKIKHSIPTPKSQTQPNRLLLCKGTLYKILTPKTANGKPSQTPICSGFTLGVCVCVHPALTR